MKPGTDEAYEKVLRNLYDKLMEPIVKELPKSTKTLIFSPDGPLSFLSFATLLTDKGRFLCEDYTIKYVSSGRDLVSGKKTNQPKGNLLVFANPTYDETPVQLAGTDGTGLALRSLDRDELRGGLKFKALPGTQKEADYLDSKAEDWMLKPEIYTGKAATEAAINGIQSPRILHLATHGFFLPEEEAKNEPRSKRLMMSLGEEQQKYHGVIRNPMHRSGLALAGAQKTLDAWARGETPPTENDGILTAAEASLLNLKGTWLVTLSACETGQGEARSGEGVLGLRRAFIQAGAQNLLMTLWPVSDKYTIPLMKDFYERAIESGDAPATLSEVQKERLLEYRKKYGTRLAVQLYGPFIMSFQGVE
jgi:CHAT domain-containing protein